MMQVRYNKNGAYSPHVVSLLRYVLDPACKGKFYMKPAKKPVISLHQSEPPTMFLFHRSISVFEDDEEKQTLHPSEVPMPTL
jgi:hypothetical protein